MKQYDGLALFSGGLDSILAAKLMEKQNKKILCLHFTSPFFGDENQIASWEKIYNLEITAVNLDTEFCKMLIQGGNHGYGSVLNPCIDCKILMIEAAKNLMSKYGAKFLVSGEVLGQRPMSQRRDSLNIIRNDANVKDILLRPLCAKHLDPISLELTGEIDRSKLLNFSGRGRKEQLALAKEYGIKVIPAPAGGCRLTEKENARRYWKLIQDIKNPNPFDFHLVNYGRQFWKENYWLAIGRNQADNEMLPKFSMETDYIFRVKNFPSPIGLGRRMGERPSLLAECTWEKEEIKRACAHLASYSNKAVKYSQSTGQEITVCISHLGEQQELNVMPMRDSLYVEPNWEDTHQDLIALRKKNLSEQN